MPFYEYKNHRINGVSQKPDFIDAPLPLPTINNTNIAFIPDEADRDYYVPDTLVEVTEQQIIDKAVEIHQTTPFGPLMNGDAWDDNDVIAWITEVIEGYKK